MNRPAIALLLLSLAPLLRAQTPSPRPKPELDKKDECSIAGMVVKLAGSEPIKGATVQLVSMDDRANSVSVETDSGGRFTIKRIIPGRYRLTVSKNAFVNQEYGQRKPGDPGSALTLSRGQDVRDLLFRLIPSAVIAGRILSEDGDPLPNVNVTALREAYHEGRHTLFTVTQFQTNDLGEYRLFGLAPGKYLVRATFTQRFQFMAAQQGAEPETAYGRLYYPGVPEASKASPIRIKAGEEIRSIEILMHRYLAYRIRGHVYNQVAKRSGRGINLMLVPRGGELEWENTDLQVRVDSADGGFEIRDVLPGSYALQAFWFDDNKAHFSQISVDVSNADLDGVSIYLLPGVNINGRILWDGPPALQDSELRIVASPVEGRTMMGGGSARADTVGAFTMQDVADGTYRPRVWGQSKDCFIKDVRYGTASALEDGFTVVRGAAAATLEITLSSRGARVQGSVADSDGLPSAGAWVVLIPDARHRSRFELYKRETTDQYGHFEFRGITPGEYKILSWEEVEDGAWEDPDFLKLFEQKGEAVEVKESDLKTVNVVAIRIAASEIQP
jgi:protocatechuate 3,4-dioxygenase beta subunit